MYVIENNRTIQKEEMYNTHSTINNSGSSKDSSLSCGLTKTYNYVISIAQVHVPACVSSSVLAGYNDNE